MAIMTIRIHILYAAVLKSNFPAARSRLIASTTR